MSLEEMNCKFYERSCQEIVEKLSSFEAAQVDGPTFRITLKDLKIALQLFKIETDKIMNSMLRDAFLQKHRSYERSACKFAEALQLKQAEELSSVSDLSTAASLRVYGLKLQQDTEKSLRRTLDKCREASAVGQATVAQLSETFSRRLVMIIW